MRKAKKAFKDQSGFTLIELLVVVVILGVIAAIVIPGILGLLGEGVEEAARTDMRSVQTEAASAYVNAREWSGVEIESLNAWQQILENDNYRDREVVQDLADNPSDWSAQITFTNSDDEEVTLTVSNDGVTATTTPE